MRQLIAGSEGFVGRKLQELFPRAACYDIGHWPTRETLEEHYDICHVATPTPMKADGSCDVSSVFDVVSKVDADLFVIRSTVSPGTTDKLEKPAIFSPEYVASSSPYPEPLGKLKDRTFMILGGYKEHTRKVRKLYQSIYPPTTKYLEVSAVTAEIIKLMENSFIGMYVTFFGEFYEICKTYAVDFEEVREGFLMDPRMSPYWSIVYPHKRGFSNSHCIKKDMTNLLKSCEDRGYNPKFIEAILENNERWVNES